MEKCKATKAECKKKQEEAIKRTGPLEDEDGNGLPIRLAMEELEPSTLTEITVALVRCTTLFLLKLALRLGYAMLMWYFLFFLDAFRKKLKRKLTPLTRTRTPFGSTNNGNARLPTSRTNWRK